MEEKRITVVVGAQYGSEAKGLACQTLIQTRRYGWAVRTGSPNAGHTVFYRGRAYAMQTIPVAWIDPTVHLVLGAGSFIDLDVLQREIGWVNAIHGENHCASHLSIDYHAFLLHKGHQQAERERGMHERMGSTAHGVGESLKARVDRVSEQDLFVNSDFARAHDGRLFTLTDTGRALRDVLEFGEERILVEGTQGTWLDFYHGEYPYVTSRSTIAANWLAEAGLPMKSTEVVGVARTFPIRVAGNSGPLPGEVSWAVLAREINRKLREAGELDRIPESVLNRFDLLERAVLRKAGLPPKEMCPAQWPAAMRVAHSTLLSGLHAQVFEQFSTVEQNHLRRLFEFTTVTRKLRRIARLDLGILRESVRINGTDWLFLNFVNYVFPNLWDKPLEQWNERERDAVRSYLIDLSASVKVPIKYVSVGPDLVIPTSGI